jgi:hypothetical protein
VELNLFLQRIAEPSFLTQTPVTCFTGLTEYPSVFLSSFFELLKKHHTVPAEPLIVHSDTVVSVKSLLGATFLGTQRVFRLCNTADATIEKSDFFTFLSSYQGPHTLFFYASLPAVKGMQKTWRVITLPEVVDKQYMKQLEPLFGHITPNQYAVFLSRLFERYTTLPFEQALQLMNYSSLVMPKNYEQFFTIIADKLVPPEQSLFALAQDFLAHKSSAFFNKWYLITDEYQEQFWMSYWANLCWRAYMFVQLMQRNEQTQANALASKQLPFAFMQRDWKLYKKNKVLLHAHNHLLELDLAIKTGRNPYALDSFFFRFFEQDVL